MNKKKPVCLGDAVFEITCNSKDCNSLINKIQCALATKLKQHLEKAIVPELINGKSKLRGKPKGLLHALK